MRSLSEFCEFGKMSTGFRWLGSSKLRSETGLCSSFYWLWSMISPSLGLKTIPKMPVTSLPMVTLDFYSTPKERMFSSVDTANGYCRLLLDYCRLLLDMKRAYVLQWHHHQRILWTSTWHKKSVCSPVASPPTVTLDFYFMPNLIMLSIRTTLLQLIRNHMWCQIIFVLQFYFRQLIFFKPFIKSFKFVTN